MNTSAKGQRVLVTAGAAGIGLAIARTFRDAGARVKAFLCTEAGSRITGQAIPVDADVRYLV